MAILVYDLTASPPRDDLALYAPGLSQEDKARPDIQAMIVRAQEIAESPRCAGRNLEKRRCTFTAFSPYIRPNIFERVRMPPIMTVVLPGWPVDYQLVGGKPKLPPGDFIRVRTLGGLDVFGRVLAPSDWITLNDDEYDLDPQRGHVVLLTSRNVNEVEVVYTGGFDFSVIGDDWAEYHKARIRQAVGMILEWLVSVGNLGRRVRSVSHTSLTFEYGDLRPPEDAVSILAMYRPVR